MRPDRSDETREEMFERQREYQAQQAERKSWLEEQNEEFPGCDYVHGVSPVLAALRSKRRATHRLFMLETMDMSKRKDASAIDEIESMALKMIVKSCDSIKDGLTLCRIIGPIRDWC